MSRQKGIGRGLGLLVAVALLGGGGSAVAQSGSAREALEMAFPGVGVLERGERVTAVFGLPMTRGATARAAMEDWLDLYAEVFGVADLQWAETRGSEISNGRVAFALQQEVAVDGGGGGAVPERLPVERGRLRVLVAPGADDFAVTYVAAQVAYPGGSIAAPSITDAQAIAAAGEDERTQHLEAWGEPELVAIQHDFGSGPEVFAAWRLVGFESEVARGTRTVVFVDAILADVVRVEPGVFHADEVTGTIKGRATNGIGPPYPTSTQVFNLPHAKACIIGETCAHADEDGVYELETTSATVSLKAMLEAPHWVTTTDDLGGQTPVETTLQGPVNPPASGVDITFNPSPSTQSDTAPVNLYRSIQRSNDFFAERLENSWPSILDNVLPGLTAYANNTEVDCWFCGGGRFEPTVSGISGSGIVLCEGRGGTPSCNNAGYSTIVSHEYGHYIVYHVIGDTTVSAFHEGWSDSLAMLVHDDDGIGFDYFLDGEYPRQPGTSTMMYPACELTPLGAPDVHTNGEVLGRIWWDIYSNVQDPDSALQLFADWTLATSGPAVPHASCDDMTQPADQATLIEVLTADDDDNILSNGTPNSDEICNAFANRGIDTQFTGSPCPDGVYGGGCRVDLNRDGVLDFFDFLVFQELFVSRDPGADCDGDGEFSFFDLLCFQNAFAAGCE